MNATLTAGQAAQQVQPVPSTTGLLQRACSCGNHTADGGECEECKKKRQQPGLLQRAARESSPADAGGADVPSIVHDVLQTPGQPLDGATRAYMEPRFGRDFGGVRVHADANAAESARAVNALAYTVGNNVIFAAGQHAPSTPAGRRLMAHELTHVVQQSASPVSLQTKLAIGAVDSPAEHQADSAAASVVVGAPLPTISSAPSNVLRRQPNLDAPASDSEPEPNFDAPQRRGGRPRSTFLDAGMRGQDQVRIAVTRYLCDCRGRNVTRTSVSTHLQPGPGVTLEICSGRVTGRLTGDVVPSSTTKGRATVRAEVNVAPGRSGVGVRGGVEAEARNTGTEPQVGGRADVRVGRPNGVQVGAGGQVFRGTQTGQVDTQIDVGADVGGVRPSIGVTNVQDPDRRGVIFGVGGNLPGQSVQNKTCRECRCPVVYDCFEDIPPRDYEEEVTYDVEDRSRLRFYFELDTNKDTPDAVLRSQSNAMLAEVARRVAGGAKIVSITGYASPEDNRDRPVPNQQLSLSRAQRLRELLSRKLGANVALPEPAAGGELLGRVATITPGSGLSDALIEAGFGDAEDVTTFLIGDDIPNAQLSEQFLKLMRRVTEPADRLRLFGIGSGSPAAPRLLAAIDRFIANNGRGRRPWEGIFGYLRFATVELGETHPEKRTESHRTSGSLKRLPDAQCKAWAREAERQGRFGPVEPEPKDESSCPTGEPRNRSGYEQRCDYSS